MPSELDAGQRTLSRYRELWQAGELIGLVTISSQLSVSTYLTGNRDRLQVFRNRLLFPGWIRFHSARGHIHTTCSSPPNSTTFSVSNHARIEYRNSDEYVVAHNICRFNTAKVFPCLRSSTGNTSNLEAPRW